MIMRIGFDLSITKINQAGTSIYAANLIKTLRQVDTGNQYLLFAVNQQSDMSSIKSVHTRLNTIYRDIIWTHTVLPYQLARASIDIIHMPANVIPLFSPCKTVVFIHDTTVFDFPEKFSVWQRTYARFFTLFAATHASAILTNSEQSKRDIIKHFKVNPTKIIVTYLAAASEFRRIPKSEITTIKQKYELKTFILTVGTLEPRKNMLRLLQAFAQLRANGFSGMLIHAGPKGWLYDDVLAEVDRLKLQDSVRFLGRVPIQDLVGLYNAASLFVYPSLYEGFGLPVLEAMACGCPVITSATSSLPEVAGDAALLVDPYNVEKLAAAMAEILDNQALATTLRERGVKQAKLFSWERCAQETLAVYNQLMLDNPL